MDPNATALVSGEGVRLSLQPAGVGSRTIAALIDAVVQAAAYLVLILIDIAVAGSGDSAALSAVAIIEIVLVLAGYPIVMEWTTRGRTVGKLCLGLRVVRDDGGPIGFRQALVRGLAGLVLEKPGLLFPLTTIAGLVTISVSAREKRLGDMMAGTVVLNERSAPQALATPPAWVPPALQPWVLSLDLHRFDDRLALSTRQFISRAYGMSPAAQMALGEDLRRRVLAVTSPPPPPGAPTPTLLVSVLAERRRRAMAAAAPAWTAPPSYPQSPGPATPPPSPPPPPWPPQPAPPHNPPDSPFARPQ
ncbi:MAG: putative rane protein YckC, family [Jatrophihabitans sp.]|nr:putative rane protein YckC, family [Jatrophihabitans sp.]